MSDLSSNSRRQFSNVAAAVIVVSAVQACASGAASEPPRLSETAQQVVNGCGVTDTCLAFQTCGAWDRDVPNDGLGYTTASPITEAGIGQEQFNAIDDFIYFSSASVYGVNGSCNAGDCSSSLDAMVAAGAAARRNQLINTRPGISTPALNGLTVNVHQTGLWCQTGGGCDLDPPQSCEIACGSSLNGQIVGYPTAMFAGPHACGACVQFQPVSCLGHPVVAGGAGHTCALIGTSMQCWGSNSRGQLGNSASSTTPSAARVTVSSLNGALQASADGGQHSCAVIAGAIRCWGNNDKGQLGDGTLASERDAPVAVTGLPRPRAQAITAGDSHSCAIVDGGAWCWGLNGNGQLGTGTTNPPENPVALAVVGLGSGVQGIAAGSSHTCAVVSAAARCWGDNSGGQLGIVPGDGTPPPTQSTTAQTVSGLGAGVQAVVAGTRHSCALLTTGGVKCWGSNDLGQLGNAPDGGPPPQARSDAPVAVTGLASGVTALIAGTNHTCALLTAGTVKCWGGNNVGQLGAGPSLPLTFAGFPVAVTGLTGVAALGAGFQHTCAVGSSGVKCWGSNGSAQLGMNVSDGMFSTTPVAISGVTCTGTGAALQCSAAGVP